MKINITVTEKMPPLLAEASAFWDTPNFFDVVQRAILYTWIVETIRVFDGLGDDQRVSLLAALFPLAEGAEGACVEARTGRRNTIVVRPFVEELTQLAQRLNIQGKTQRSGTIVYALDLVCQLERARRELSDAEYLGWLAEHLEAPLPQS